MIVVPATMRAVQLTGYGGLEKLVLRDDLPLPAPAPGEVLVRVGACGMNNTDINLRTRWYDRSVVQGLSEEVGLKGAAPSEVGNAAEASWKTETVQFPRIQGAAVAGTVVAVGRNVSGARIGERVILDPQIRGESLPRRAQLVAYLGGDRDGGFAEYVVAPSENAHAHRSSLSDAELATFPTSYDTAEEMLARAGLAEGETVLVTGAAGGVGTALVQLARVRGASVIALAGASKRERLLELGADHFIAREGADLRSAVEAIAGPEGIHVVADVIGGPMFPWMLKVLRRGGRYCCAGAIAGPVQPMDLRDLIYKDLEMYGITCPTRETFSRVVRLVEDGRIRPLLERRFPLCDLARAQSEFVRRNHVGKFVIEP